MDQKELVPIKNKVSVLAKQVEAFEIRGSDDMNKAVVVLSELNKYADNVKEKKELLTKPLNEALKNARKMFAPVENLYEGAIEMLRAKMGAYQTEQVRIKREEETRIAMRVKAGKGNLTVETAVKKLEALPTVDKEIATDSGLVQFRESKVLKVVDEKLVPREYLIINEKMLLADLKLGKVVPGVTLESVQVPVNYR